MSDKPSTAWYLAPIFLGIIGSAIMWYVLKDEDHPDSPKMIKKGWVIGIVLTLIPLLMMIPMLLLIPMTAMNDFDEMQDHMRVIPGPIVQMVPAPGFEDDQQMMNQWMNTMMNDPQMQQQMMDMMMNNPQMMQSMMNNQQFMQQLNP